MIERVEVWIDDELAGEGPARVGELRAAGERGRMVTRFRYDSRWLVRGAGGFAIDPELPLGEGDFFPGAGCALHGALRDTSPDRWGRRLMDRRERDEATRERRRARALTEWDYMLGVQDAGRLGALRLRDPESGCWLDERTPGIPPVARLRQLEAAAARIDADSTAPLDPAIASLIQPGSSLGGARPKATFRESDGSLWLAKFPSRDDRLDVGAAEYLLNQLARACDIEVPPAWHKALGGRGRTFCVQRFDRRGSRRRMFWSAMTLLGKSDRDDAGYLDIAEALQNQADANTVVPDLHQLYRRALFNILVGNRDDHLRNHGFLRQPSGWSLAPAFDLNVELDRLEHSLSIDESDHRPSPENLRATAELYRLTPAAAARIEDELRARLANWRAMAKSIGIPGNEIDLLDSVILRAGI
ncbi:MAG: type II toxin-antitoxin system HipA family toxin [Planctomycetota bacterium]